ncbi:MAG TPA: TSUP family transporter [Methanotrichaceae archaeon]|nr:TSUP family transporter [Methanotrichaceae archaeon]
MVGGSVAGFLAGLFGISGEAAAMVLSALDMPRAIFIATGGSFTFIIDASRVAAYMSEGIRLEPALWDGLIIFILASLLGSILGRRMVDKIPQSPFRKVIAVLLLAAGLKLALLP